MTGVPPGVARGAPYPLAARGTRGDRTVVAIGGGAGPVLVGGAELAVIAGPCAVEGAETLLSTAAAVRAAGASALRGGAYKPRSSPYSFQGLGDPALEMLAAAREATGLPVVTEVLDPRQVERVAAVADVLQIGARNMHNFPLLTEAGRSGRPVLLKRGFAARIEELLLAAEYVMAAGSGDVILCERGIRTFETATRNTLDVAAIPVLKAETHLPVIVDPSHAGGRAELVAPLSLAAVAAGADGLIIEVHDDGARALSDGDQAITPAELAGLLRTLRVFAAAAGRHLSEPPAGDDAAALETLRTRIEEADRTILDLVRLRADLARQAGTVKRALGVPVIDPAREVEVERLMRARALALALPARSVHALARALIELARAAQDVGDAGDGREESR